MSKSLMAVVAESFLALPAYGRGARVPRCRGLIPAPRKEVIDCACCLLVSEAGVSYRLHPVPVWQVGACLLTLPILAKALNRLG